MTCTGRRSLSPHEKAVLRNTTTFGGAESFFVAFVTFIFSEIVIGLYFLSLVDKFHPRFPWAIHLFGFLISMALGFVVYRWHAFSSRYSRRFRSELREGVAEVWIYRPLRAVRVEEFENNGIGSYLDLGGNKMLFLMGHHISELTKRGNFPNTEIEVAYTPKLRLVVGVTCLGEYLPPLAGQVAFDEEDFRRGKVPDDGAVIDGAFETILARTPKS